MNNFYYISQSICLLALFIGIILYSYHFLYFCLGFSKPIKFKKATKQNKFAILIPALNESKVICDLLNSIKNQTYSNQNYKVVIVVKDEKDPTVNIAKEYGFDVVVNPVQTCKGDALDSAIKYLYKINYDFDAYLICDADNVLSEEFLSKVNDAVDEGYDLGMGYRNTKNWNSGWISSGSALTFSLINTMANKARVKFGGNCIYSGTGFFIKKQVLEEYKGWPFRTLTEDMEISMYALVNQLKTTYVEEAEFFDEQPTDFKTSFKQRVRWIKGYIQVRKLYSKKISKCMKNSNQNKWTKFEHKIGILPLAIILVSVIASMLLLIGQTIYSLAVNQFTFKFLLNLLIIILTMYIVLAVITFIVLLAEKERINISTKNKIICILMNPIFMISYIPIAIKALLSKNVGWAKIEHKQTISELTNQDLNRSNIESEEQVELKN